MSDNYLAVDAEEEQDGSRTTHAKVNIRVNSSSHPRPLGKVFQYMPYVYNKKNIGKPRDNPTVDDAAKQKLRHILHSKAFHLIIIVLVLVDGLLVVVEFLFDFHIIGPEDGEHVTREIAHGFSIGILTLFVIELIFKLWADRRHFIHNKIEVLDALVVMVSLVVDIALVFIDSVALLAIELLIFLRLWRAFRIINGIILVANAKTEELQAKLDETKKEVDSLKGEIETLKAKLHMHGIEH